LALAAAPVGAQTQARVPSLAERLGYKPDARLLIVHADDLGFSHAVDAAAFRALESGAVSSASAMAPCPWFPEVVDYARSHPDADLGLHLTLTSERVFYRWGPVASRELVPSLLDANGYFRQDWPEPNAIRPEEAERELRAQVERALAMGLRPTHVDSHQFRLYENGRALFEALLRVAHAYRQPALAPGDVVIDRVVTIGADVSAERWADFYTDALRALPPGVTELVVHPGLDGDELQAMTRERATWGAAWRQRDFDFLSS